MTLVLLFATILALCLMAPLMVHPVSLGLNVLFITILLGLFIPFQMSSWFGFILIMVYVGGLLVVFAYMVSLVPNALFKYNHLFIFPLLWLAMGTFFLFTNLFNMNTLALKTLSFPWSFSEFNNGLILATSESLWMFYFLVSLLFFVLMMVSKVCYTVKGPLRPF